MPDVGVGNQVSNSDFTHKYVKLSAISEISQAFLGIA